MKKDFVVDLGRPHSFVKTERFSPEMDDPKPNILMNRRPLRSGICTMSTTCSGNSAE